MAESRNRSEPKTIQNVIVIKANHPNVKKLAGKLKVSHPFARCHSFLIPAIIMPIFGKSKIEV